jgi:D-alanyl-lipoteichoic acid acyltransferase DltB (MBOAT superfamily)
LVFNSLTFVVFFAVVLLLHNLPLSWRTRKFALLIASYLFYAAWNPPFVVLLWISTVVDWFVARGLALARGPALRRALLCASLATNLGLLAFFKYGNFALESFITMSAGFGIDFQPVRLDVVLPVGISFYTFQTLSYTIDIFRGRARPWASFLDFALFVTFFPQLVAGPIVRAVAFLPQCVEPARVELRHLGWGLALFVIGVFEKVVIADGLAAPIADAVFSAARAPTFAEAWGGAFAFSVQIFCDFAGYSSCAIGVAMCLGFSIPDNFRTPYAAVGFSDFWRRWHISLSSWLRDYLYIPLGGNRRGAARTYVNLMITMLLGGLWHGASWTFVLWGGLHGLYLMGERAAQRFFPLEEMNQRMLFRCFYGLFTYALVCVAWVFFRAESFDSASTIAQAMLGAATPGEQALLSALQVQTALWLTLGTLAVHWVLRDSSLDQHVGRWPWWLTALGLAALVVLIFTTPGEDRAFIYFQF